MGQFTNVTTYLVVLVVVFTVLNVIRGNNLDISVALVLFPVEKVHLLKKLLLVMLELSDHDWSVWCRGLEKERIKTVSVKTTGLGRIGEWRKMLTKRSGLCEEIS